ncbi:HVO_0649 family zinc finger protein [Natronobacterium gregoryi]|uniref:Small CPxCG-related zinc finger protein n=2 Tax=Natronobacterium gregoryi TaxID=44930 RepID=L0AEP5_NATGS|nr:HVO_0649 family zinc finger protein [Natronobacterium gregoryi]AFZ72306.1 hypothetical protein Natgr_1076 [Natronobacterium gregoryi SP2]ELY62419.1 hypothetical protein C490_18078 [Natronobacterium gregoryi SP2]PLK18481.1 hypothetical protein CYV19_17785 [Natronobacterium gregoryi SP2]SFJ70059.1 hypothetical protein SAMN05443661_16016 [Natronobacterium gregoryi]
MAPHSSPFARLREKFEEPDLECRQCGYLASNSEWHVETTGGRVQYQFVCPVCEAAEVREVRLKE